MLISEKKLLDSELFKLFKSGQEEFVIEYIIHHYQQRLFWHIQKLVQSDEDSKDILQNTYIKIWKALDSFKGNSQLYTWIYKIATNEALLFIRNKRKITSISIDRLDNKLSETLKSYDCISPKPSLRKLNKAIKTLPKKQALVFRLKYFKELKYEEISKNLNTSVGALKSSYHYAVKKIEHCLLTA